MYLLPCFLFFLVTHHSTIPGSGRQWRIFRTRCKTLRFTHKKHGWYNTVLKIPTTAITSQTREGKGYTGVSFAWRKRQTWIKFLSWIWHQRSGRYCIACCLCVIYLSRRWYLKKWVRTISECLEEWRPHKQRHEIRHVIVRKLLDWFWF